MKADAWCAANDISHLVYYDWLRKIRQTTCAEFAVTATPPVTEVKQLEVVAPKQNGLK